MFVRRPTARASPATGSSTYSMSHASTARSTLSAVASSHPPLASMRIVAICAPTCERAPRGCARCPPPASAEATFSFTVRKTCLPGPCPPVRHRLDARLEEERVHRHALSRRIGEQERQWPAVARCASISSVARSKAASRLGPWAIACGRVPPGNRAARAGPPRPAPRARLHVRGAARRHGAPTRHRRPSRQGLAEGNRVGDEFGGASRCPRLARQGKRGKREKSGVRFST